MAQPTLRTRIPTATADQVLAARDALVIDLRTPAEHAEDHLPDAVNVPLFDDAERALIGTLYKQSSPDAAFDEARGLARERIGALVAAIARVARWSLPRADLAERLDALTSAGIDALDASLEIEELEHLPERAIVLHCWRGGLRSRSVVAFVRRLGLERAVGLAHGYKGYRREVLAGLERWRSPPAYALRGLTGVGKTLVLRELERARPGWTVDLEALAGHRSSILGSVGLEPCSQKAFESRLHRRLGESSRSLVVLEGESRKVGDAIVPGGVWRALEGATNVELVAPRERRVQVLIDDYLEHEASRGELRQRLPFIEERLGRERWGGALVTLLDQGRERELVEVLLEHYYDPLYRHSEREHDYATTIDASDPRRAADEVATWIERRLAGTP